MRRCVARSAIFPVWPAFGEWFKKSMECGLMEDARKSARGGNRPTSDIGRTSPDAQAFRAKALTAPHFQSSASSRKVWIDACTHRCRWLKGSLPSATFVCYLALFRSYTSRPTSLEQAKNQRRNHDNGK